MALLRCQRWAQGPKKRTPLLTRGANATPPFCHLWDMAACQDAETQLEGRPRLAFHPFPPVRLGVRAPKPTRDLVAGVKRLFLGWGARKPPPIAPLACDPVLLEIWSDFPDGGGRSWCFLKRGE